MSVPTPIVIDALNFLGTVFCPMRLATSTKPWKRVDAMSRNVKRTLNAFKDASYDPIFVIDAGFSSIEVLSTWVSRREREVKRGVRNIPYNADTLLAALLLRLGAKVVRATELDADDICISIAQRFACGIVSGDTDMLRYEDWDASEKLFSHWIIDKQNGLQLVPQPRKSPPRHKIAARNAKATSANLNLHAELVKSHHLKLILTLGDGVYRRGNADENTRALGNLHAIARPLRRALYARLDIPRVREIYPEWDSVNDKVVWVDEFVYASDRDASLMSLLDDAHRMCQWLELHAAKTVVDSSKRESRRFAQTIMAAELAAAASENPSILSELHIAESLRDQKKQVSGRNTLEYLPQHSTPGHATTWVM